MNQEAEREQWIPSEVMLVRRINIEADPVWQMISAVGGVQHWVPMIKDCHLEGRGVGAYRLCVTEAGIIREVIDRIDHIEQVFEYSITEQSVLPFKNFKGMIKIAEIESVQTEVHWRARYDILSCYEATTREAIGGMFEEAIQGLCRFCQV